MKSSCARCEGAVDSAELRRFTGSHQRGRLSGGDGVCAALWREIKTQVWGRSDLWYKKMYELSVTGKLRHLRSQESWSLPSRKYRKVKQVSRRPKDFRNEVTPFKKLKMETHQAWICKMNWKEENPELKAHQKLVMVKVLNYKAARRWQLWKERKEWGREREDIFDWS